MIDVPTLLAGAVRRLPTIGETHWLKAALAITRFARRYPHWGEALLQQALERSGWANAPEIGVLIHASVQGKELKVDPRGAQRHIARTLFPLAYRSARTWYGAAGLEAILAAYRQRAVHEGTYLGHGWTVWCSFFEIAPLLETEEARLFALERFVEFAAKCFPGFPTSDPHWAPPVRPDPGPVDPSRVLDAALERPGFFGHHLLTLGYLHRHKEQLTDRDWWVGLDMVNGMAHLEYVDPEDNVQVPAGTVPDDPVGDEDLERALLHLILQGPNNPHSLTLADISYDLWQVAGERQRRHLLHYLKRFVE